jgi:hypothetical protein
VLIEHGGGGGKNAVRWRCASCVMAKTQGKTAICAR